MFDVTPHIQAKSDQLNADDLVGGPITVQITHANQGGAEQPVILRISGGHMPWKPSKTALRVLVAAWGTDAGAWVGRWVTLYRDSAVKWAGVAVGGIRVSALSHIDQPITLSLAETRGQKKTWRVDVIRPANQKQAGAPTADLDALLVDAALTTEDVDRWLASKKKPALAGVTPEQRAALATTLAGNPKLLDAIRALIPATDADFPE